MAASLLKWFLAIQVGLGALWAFLGHYFKSDEIARFIGWPEGNPFQKEVAFTNLALGLGGVLCILFGQEFWLAVIFFATAFLGGAFTVHVGERKRAGNRNPGNAGAVFFSDIATPIVLWVFYILI